MALLRAGGVHYGDGAAPPAWLGLVALLYDNITAHCAYREGIDTAGRKQPVAAERALR